MKARKTNIVNKKRNKLEEVIPLNTPYTIAIDPSNMCNFKCKFCAIQSTNELMKYKKQLMSLEMFEKIVNDIREFDEKLKVLRISGQGEPLLNKELPKMIKIAKVAEIAEWIEVVTNGSLLNPKLNTELVSSGVNRIRISIEALDEEGYKNIANAKIDFQKFLCNIKDLYEKSRGLCEIYIKTVNVAVPELSSKKLFYNMFGDICDKIFIDNVIPLWSDYNELEQEFKIDNKIGAHGQNVVDVRVCVYPFYSFLINPDGDVTMCCADWRRIYVIGNVGQDTLKNIWKGKKLRSFWENNLDGEKEKHLMCKGCVLPKYDCQDNIDIYSKSILENLKKFNI